MAEWLSRWPRDPITGTNRACAKDKPASGPLARRGSNPFPGAINIKLDKSSASISFGLFEDFCRVVIADVLLARELAATPPPSPSKLPTEVLVVAVVLPIILAAAVVACYKRKQQHTLQAQECFSRYITCFAVDMYKT